MVLLPVMGVDKTSAKFLWVVSLTLQRESSGDWKVNITGYSDLDLAIQGPSREASHDNEGFFCFFICLVGFF